MLFSGLTLDLDITYILVLLLFLVPLAILNGLVFGPFMKLFRDRHERLEGALVRAGTRLDEAEAKARTFDEKIKVATAKGMAARDRIRAEAQVVMTKRLEEERRRLNEKIEAAVKDIDASKQKALTEVDASSQKLAEMTASKLLGRQV